MSSFGILILAAGSSSRLGKPKQLLNYRGKTFIRHVIDLAIQLTPDKLVCVLGAGKAEILPEIPDHVESIVNGNWQSGMGSSIVAGIEYMRYKVDAVMVLLVDQPKISLGDLTQLKTLHHQNPSKVIATTYDGKPGVPAIFPSICFEELLELDGDKGARSLLLKWGAKVLLHECSSDITDIDTVLDYQSFLESNK